MYEHKWIVFSTALVNSCLMLICEHCNINGTINNPTKKEWEEAFYAPSKSYEWKGGNNRVTIR